MEKTLEIPEGCRLFQSVTARMIFSGDRTMKEVIARTIGIVRENKVIEEYNLNGQTLNITGFKL